MDSNTKQQNAYICAVSILTRSDKRKDRVEINPEQLTAATAEAEISFFLIFFFFSIFHFLIP